MKSINIAPKFKKLFQRKGLNTTDRSEIVKIAIDNIMRAVVNSKNPLLKMSTQDIHSLENKTIEEIGDKGYLASSLIGKGDKFNININIIKAD